MKFLLMQEKHIKESFFMLSKRNTFFNYIISKTRAAREKRTTDLESTLQNHTKSGEKRRKTKLLFPSIIYDVYYTKLEQFVHS